MNVILERYQKNKIGHLIAWGSDHFVYDYDKDKVIKFSVIGFIMGKHGRTKLEQDYLISKQFFGKYVLDTEFRLSENGKWTGAIQKKITGRYLFRQDLKDLAVNEQFQEIIMACQNMASKGNPKVDLVGKGGVLKNCFSNIFITASGQLHIIDATLFDFKGTGIFYPFFLIITKLGIWRNKSLIKHFMKINLK